MPADEEGSDCPLAEKRCERCGLRGYYIENGLCLDCIEAELRRNANSGRIQNGIRTSGRG